MSLADELTASSGFQNVIKAPAHETQFSFRTALRTEWSA